MEEVVILNKRNHSFNIKKVFISVPFEGLARDISLDFAYGFKSLGLEVYLFDDTFILKKYSSILKNKKEDYKLLAQFYNKDFMYEYLNFEPDLFFSLSNSFYNKKTLDIGHRIGVKNTIYLTSFFKENNFDFAYYRDKIDGIFSIREEKVIEGIKNFKLYPGVDISKFFPTKKEAIYNVIFIGAFSDYRLEVIRFLSENEIKVDIWGNGWEALKKYSNEFFNIHEEKLTYENLNRILNSTKIFLSLPQDILKNSYSKPWINPRLFTAAACGVAIIGYFKDSSIIDNFKENEEILLYSSKEDLYSKIKLLLQDEGYRITLGQRAARRTASDHTITKRAEYIIRIISTQL